MDTNGVPKYDGQLVKLGQREYVIPSLSTRQARALWPLILDINQGITLENIPEKHEKILKLIHAAISRNYPDVKIEDLEDDVDLTNIRTLQMIVIGQSGLAASPGAQPAAGSPINVSIGSMSTGQ